MSEGTQRRLTAIVSVDVVGYSRLMGVDEIGTLDALRKHRTELIDPLISQHGGRIVKTMGDGLLLEFSSVVEATQCAIEVQKGMAERNDGIDEDTRITFRIGVNLGDIIIEGEDILGDGVNIAARLQEIADPGGVSISLRVYEDVRDRLDTLFENAGEQMLKNISRPMQVWRWSPAQQSVFATQSAVADATFALPDKPSVAVLPFDNMSGDPEQEYFADGLAEDIITTLSKISSLFVIARNSSFAFKGAAVDVRHVAAGLGVRYILEGSVRQSANRLRINAQLVDATDGHHLWAERYDREIAEIFALQDEITEKIVAALQVKLTEGEQEQMARRYTENLEAYDHFLRGRDQVRATNVTNAQARAMFERAIELDPRFAAAYAILSYCHWRDWFNQWSEDPQNLEQAFEAAKKSVNLDESLPLARAFLAWAYLWKGHHEQAIAEARWATSLDPNFAEGYARLGEILSLAGRPEEGIDLIKKAMRLDPHFPPNYLIYLGHAYFAMGKYKEAILAMKRSLTGNPDFLHPHRTLAVIFSELGRTEEAQAEVAEILRINPRASLKSQRERMAFNDQAVSEQYLESLRKAGLPE
jgi:TolB-like protein/cytochrome c-type biogenesis protein CcmH/NrfG